MSKKHLSPLEAWNDFYSTFKGNKPSELYIAQQTCEGRVVQPKSGKPKELGAKRIRRLLDKYAPGQYEFHEGSPYFTKPTKKPPSKS